jgi:hypothetical protein
MYKNAAPAHKPFGDGQNKTAWLNLYFFATLKAPLSGTSACRNKPASFE